MRGVENIPWLYDSGMAVMDALGMGRWRMRLVGPSRGRVLEIGCGTGRSLPLYPKGTELWGIDPDEAALRRARHRAPSAPLFVGRAEHLPFATASFDTVTTSLSFCSVTDVAAALAEVRRVLRDEGGLRMLEHVRSAGMAGRVQDFIQPAWTRFTGGCHLNRDTEAAVAAAGFRIDPQSRHARGVMRCFTAYKA